MRFACASIMAGWFLFGSHHAAWADDEAYVQLSIHTQVLAASCAACHGTNGNSVGGTPVLAGLQADYFISQMQAFRTGERASTVMHRHAKGLTEAEILQLAEHFSKQTRVTSSLPARPEKSK